MVPQHPGTTTQLDRGYKLLWSCYCASIFCHSLPTRAMYWKMFWKCKKWKCLYFESLQSCTRGSGNRFGVRKDLWEEVGGERGNKPSRNIIYTTKYILRTSLSKWPRALKWEGNAGSSGWVNQHFQHSSLFCFLPSPPKNTRRRRLIFHAWASTHRSLQISALVTMEEEQYFCGQMWHLWRGCHQGHCWTSTLTL